MIVYMGMDQGGKEHATMLRFFGLQGLHWPGVLLVKVKSAAHGAVPLLSISQ